MAIISDVAERMNDRLQGGVRRQQAAAPAGLSLGRGRSQAQRRSAAAAQNAARLRAQQEAARAADAQRYQGQADALRRRGAQLQARLLQERGQQQSAAANLGGLGAFAALPTMAFGEEVLGGGGLSAGLKAAGQQLKQQTSGYGEIASTLGGAAQSLTAAGPTPEQSPYLTAGQQDENRQVLQHMVEGNLLPGETELPSYSQAQEQGPAFDTPDNRLGDQAAGDFYDPTADNRMLDLVKQQYLDNIRRRYFQGLLDQYYEPPQASGPGFADYGGFGFYGGGGGGGGGFERSDDFWMNLARWNI